MNYRQQTPTLISILTRKLKPGKTFEDFQKAHLPPGQIDKSDFGYDVDYFSVPTRVINSVSAADPTVIVSVGFSYGNVDDIFSGIAKKLPTEKERHNKIAEVAEKIGVSQVFIVKTDNNYGGSNPDFEQVPLTEVTPELLERINALVPQKLPPK